MPIRPNDDDFDGLDKDFERELKRARRKAGRKVGGLIKRKQKRKMRSMGYSDRRLAAIRTAVGRDGTLVALDHAPFAREQNEGGVIRSNSAEMMTIPIEPNARIPSEGTFSTRLNDGRAFLFQKRKFADAARVSEAAREMGIAVNKVRAIPVARLVKELRFDPTLGYAATVESYLDKYVDEIDENLFEGR